VPKEPEDEVGADHPVPSLTDHSLDDSGSPISTLPAVFQEQMAALRAAGFQALSLGELLDGRENDAKLPAPPLVLCFDDGFANVLDHGAQLLRELVFGASVFAVVDY
jgi:hypothetical protein